MTPAEARDYAAARLGSAYRSIQLGGPYACRWHVIAHAGRPVSAEGETVEEAVAACLAALAAAEERE